MKNKFLAIFLLGALLLAACSGAVDATEADEAAADSGVENEAAADADSAAEEGSTAEGSAEGEAAEEEPFTDAENPCLPFSVLDVSLSTPYPGLPPVSEDDYVTGPDDAILTFTVYSEPQCPYCAQFDPVLDAFQAMYPDDVRVVFRLRPLGSIHDKSNVASQAMVAAGMQGKFNEFKTFIFERQYQDPNDPEQVAMPADEFWAGVAPDNFDAWLEARVPDLGIDYAQLNEDMYSDDVVAKVKASGDNASAIGITGTPTLLINGYSWPEGGNRGIEIFSIYLRLLKNQAVEMDECAPTVIDEAKTYSATITTTQGDIVVDLFPDKAPLAVNSFVYLAQQGWYDNLPILSSDEFVLSGDPSDTGYGGAGYAYMDETSDLTFDEPGMLAVYSIWPGYGYNGSMFFINKTALTEQGNRTIFGQVTSGMDVVEKITLRSNIFETVQDEVLGITITEE